MRVTRPDAAIDKGWFAGPWDSDLAINIGYANAAVAERHYHRTMTEIYFIARGNVILDIDGQEVTVHEKSAVIIEPGEVHMFLESSPDHYHFVVQTPGLQGAAAKTDKVVVE